MSTNPFGGEWAPLLSETDREVIRRGGYGQRAGKGEHPALVLVDFQYGYVGEDAPILEQLREWPTAGGEAAWRAVRQIAPALDLARKAEVPVLFTRIAYLPDEESPFAAKRGAPDYFLLGNKGTEIVEELAPRAGEAVITKPAASAFFGTDFEERLRRLEVDSLIVAGLSTSGCVRATVVDAAARGYRVAVVADAVADRIELSHKVTLLDVWMKYGDLIAAAEVGRYLDGIPTTTRAQ